MIEIQTMLAAATMRLRAQFESPHEDFRLRLVIAGVATTAVIVVGQTAWISVV